MSRFPIQAQALVRKTSSDVVELIRAAILDGRLAPGDRLKEEELARELGISRTPVREALLILQREDLVVAEPHRGAWVRSYTPAELDEMYEIRALLEGHAARRAAANATDEQLARLRESCERFEQLANGDPSALVEENVAFHELIVEIADSPRLARMLREVTAMPLMYRLYALAQPERRSRSTASHRELVAALARRDGDAAAAIVGRGVFQARDFLLATLEQQRQQQGEDEQPAEARR